MASPVKFGSIQPPKMEDLAHEEEPGNSKDVQEVEAAQPSFQDEFDNLMGNYIYALLVSYVLKKLWQQEAARKLDS